MELNQTQSKSLYKYTIFYADKEICNPFSIGQIYKFYCYASDLTEAIYKFNIKITNQFFVIAYMAKTLIYSYAIMLDEFEDIFNTDNLTAAVIIKELLNNEKEWVDFMNERRDIVRELLNNNKEWIEFL